MIGDARYNHRFSNLPEPIQVWANEHYHEDLQRVAKRIREFVSLGADTAGCIQAQLIKEAESVHPVSQWHKDWFYATAALLIQIESKGTAENEDKN